MKYTFIEPELSWPREALTQSLTQQAKKMRIDMEFGSSDNLESSMTQAIERKVDTIVACGSEIWLTRIISLACKLSLQKNTEVPIFARIQPPRFLPGLDRIPSYLDGKMRSALATVSARKIIEQPVYNCGNAIWFQAQLELMRKPQAIHPAKITLLTPSGSKLTIHASFDRIIFHNEYNILDHQDQHLTVQAHKQHISSSPSQSDLMESVRQKVDTRYDEEVFRLQASRMLIEGQNSYDAVGFPAELTEKITIRQADFPIRLIVPKNDILKY